MLLASETHGGWFEGYVELLTDPAHLLLELTLIIVVDVLIGMVAWPFAKQWLKNHDAKKHAHEHCDDAHGDQG